MKKTFLMLLALVAMSFATFAQVQTPAPSPLAKVEQMVGLTTVSLEYSRPGVKGRAIFGDLVPFDKIWRTGANQATKITFSDDVTLEGKEVPAGTYAIYSMPGKSEWTVMIYKDLSIGGNVSKYDEAQELTRFTVKPEALDREVESMTMFIDHLRNDGAHIYLAWAKTQISMKLDVNTDKAVMASIDRTLAGPAYLDYYRSAVYFYEADKDVDKAMEFITKANEMNPDKYWVMTWMARIQAKKGDKKAAMATSKKAKELAEKAPNPDYVKINEDLMAELEG